MFQGLKYLVLCIGFFTFCVVITACQKNTVPAEPSMTSSPTFTLMPTVTLLPGPTYHSTATASQSSTPTVVTPTLQLPKSVFTPLPFTPEPISVLNAGQIQELTRWEINNPTFWQAPDGSSSATGTVGFAGTWSFQLAFSSKGTLLFLEPLLPSTGYVAHYGIDQFTVCTLGGYFYELKNYPGIMALSVPESKPIKLIIPDILKYLETKPGYYLYSSNGETLAMLSEFCTIQFYSIETGSITGKIDPLRGENVGYSGNGKIFWSGPDHNGFIAFLNPQNGEILQKTKVEWKQLAVVNKNEAGISLSFPEFLKNQDEIPELYKAFNIIAISPDRKTFITSIHLRNITQALSLGDGRYGQVIIKGKLKIIQWDMSSGAMLHLWVEKDEWKNEPIAAYSPDSKQAAIYISSDKKIELFDTATGKLSNTLGKSDYHSLAYSPDGQILIAGTSEGLEFWDITRGTLLREIPQPGNLSHWAISPDGRYLGTITEDDRISLWGVLP
jgi:hypothetical protein